VTPVRDTDEVVQQLQRAEERLRELAYERLRTAAEDGDADAEADERKIQQARRAVERALRALGAEPEF
jgi:hypothetical protein